MERIEVSIEQDVCKIAVPPILMERQMEVREAQP